VSAEVEAEVVEGKFSGESGNEGEDDQLGSGASLGGKDDEVVASVDQLDLALGDDSLNGGSGNQSDDGVGGDVDGEKIVENVDHDTDDEKILSSVPPPSSDTDFVSIDELASLSFPLWDETDDEEEESPFAAAISRVLSLKSLPPSLPLIDATADAPPGCATVDKAASIVTTAISGAFNMFGAVTDLGEGTTVRDVSTTSRVISSSRTYSNSFLSTDFALEILGTRSANLAIGGPEEALSPSLSKGSCWAMAGKEGHITVGLENPGKVVAVSIGRSAEGKVETIPKFFKLFGVDGTGSRRILGTFEYDIEGELHQTFKILNFLTHEVVSLEIADNHGNDDYTCLYRLQIWVEE